MCPPPPCLLVKQTAGEEMEGNHHQHHHCSFRGAQDTRPRLGPREVRHKGGRKWSGAAAPDGALRAEGELRIHLPPPSLPPPGFNPSRQGLSGGGREVATEVRERGSLPPALPPPSRQRVRLEARRRSRCPDPRLFHASPRGQNPVHPAAPGTPSLTRLQTPLPPKYTWNRVPGPLAEVTARFKRPTDRA